MSPIATLNPPEVVQQYGSEGVSGAAEDIKAMLRKVGRHLEEPVSSVRSRLESAAIEVYRASSVDNWDCEGAKAIASPALTEALIFIGSLPARMLAPALAAEPSGAIGFEWENAAQDVMAASVIGKGTLSFAAVFVDGTRIRGLEKLSGSLPSHFGRLLVGHFSRGAALANRG